MDMRHLLHAVLQMVPEGNIGWSGWGFTMELGEESGISRERCSVKGALGGAVRWVEQVQPIYIYI